MYVFLIIVLSIIVISLLIIKNKKKNLSFKYFGILIGLGILAIIISIILETIVGNLLIWSFAGYYKVSNGKAIWINYLAKLMYYLIFDFLVIAVIEEGSKNFIVRRLDRVDDTITTTLDCIIQFVIVGAVFSLIEDITYIVKYDVGLVRFLTSLGGHFLYAIVFGYYFAKSKIYKEFTNIGVRLNAKGYNLKGAISSFQEKKFSKYAVIMPILLHGLHNFTCHMLPGLVTVLIIVEYIVFFVLFIKSLTQNKDIKNEAINLFIKKYPSVTKEEIDEIVYS